MFRTKNMFFAVIIIGIIITVSILGCCPAPQQAASNPQAKQVSKKITIWHWMTDRKDTFNELAKKYKAQTGVDVEFMLFFPPDIFSQKVIAAARAGNLPDIFGILGEKKTLGSFVKAGHILDLTSYMQQDNNRWQESFYPQTLAVNIFEPANSYDVMPGIYAAPIDTTVMQFVYNKSILQEAGLNPDNSPKTLDEFIDYAKKAKEKTGKDGFVCGFGEGWLLHALATEWAINIMGEDKFVRTIKGEVSYTDPDWIEVFNIFSKLKDSSIFVSNIASLNNKESEDAFSRGKAAFSFNGSWAVNVYNQLNPGLDYSFFSLPTASSKFPAKIWGGAGSSFMIHAKSANKEEAVKFLKWLTQKEQQIVLIKETNNLPAIKGCEAELPPKLSVLIADLFNLTHPNIWPKNEDSRVIEVFDSGLQQIVMGIKQPKDVAQEVQNTKDRLSKK